MLATVDDQRGSDPGPDAQGPGQNEGGPGRNEGGTGAGGRGEARPDDTGWRPDLLGEDFRRRAIPLGEDPDGEGPIEATLVRYEGAPAFPRAVFLFVHGLSDYFFHRHLAEFLASRGIATYGLDLRKCGRSRTPALTPHYVSDLALYDTELDAALARCGADHPGVPVIAGAHSTGGLVVPLWLARRRDAGRPDPVAGLVLDSPWFDLDVPRRIRPAVDALVGTVGRVRPRSRIPLPTSERYGRSTHSDFEGDFDYDLELKPLGGVGIRVGWLRAVRRAQRRLQAGLGLPHPVLLLRSTASYGRGDGGDDTDLIRDVESMRRYAPRISDDVTEVAIPGARHDVFLSRPDVLDVVLRELGDWLDETLGAR